MSENPVVDPNGPFGCAPSEPTTPTLRDGQIGWHWRGPVRDDWSPTEHWVLAQRFPAGLLEHPENGDVYEIVPAFLERVEVGPSPEQDRRRNANARYSSE